MKRPFVACPINCLCFACIHRSGETEMRCRTGCGDCAYRGFAAHKCYTCTAFDEVGSDWDCEGCLCLGCEADNCLSTTCKTCNEAARRVYTITKCGIRDAQEAKEED
jgi:hypothetical protein